MAQETELGWILSGKIRKTSNNLQIVSLVSNTQIEKQLEMFWDVEDVKETHERKFTEEEQRCEDFFQKTHERDETGRFITRLPFREDNVTFGRSKHIAMATLLQLEKRFKRNPELREQYSKCIQEYLDLGHMIPVKDSEEDFAVYKDGKKEFKCYYLPHHAVFKQSSFQC